MADEDLVNALAQYLELEPVEKQALLERRRPARPLPLADRAARDESDRVPPQVEWSGTALRAEGQCTWRVRAD